MTGDRGRVDIRLLETRDDVEAVVPEWSRLAERHEAVFQSPAFALGWMDSSAALVAARLAVFVAALDGRVVGVLPTCTAVRGGIRMVTWLGGFASVDSGGMLYGDCEVPRETIVRALLRTAAGSRRGMLHLHNIRDDSPDLAVYDELLAPIGHDSAPFATPESLRDADYRGRLHGGHMARLANRMRADGPFDVLNVGVDHPRLPEWFDRFVELRRRRFHALGQSSPLQDDMQAQFYLRQLSVNPDARFSVLRFRDELAAASFGFETRRRFYGVISAFDEGLARYSPSTVLLGSLLRSELSSGRVFELGVGDEPYKRRWASGAALLTTYASKGLRTRAFLAGRALRHRLRSPGATHG